MKKSFRRSVTAFLLSGALLLSSQGIVTAFADNGGNSDMSELLSVQTTQEQKPCTKNSGCTLTEGHEGDCVLEGNNEEQKPCTKTEGCTLLEGHEGDCVLEGNNDNEEQKPCTKTEGCTLTEGHEGDCVLEDKDNEEQKPCTKTEGCTLPEGHEGDCVVEEAKPSEAVQNVIDLIDDAVAMIAHTEEEVETTDGGTMKQVKVTMFKDLDPANNPELKALIDKEAAHEQDETQPDLSEDEAAKLSEARKTFEDAKAVYLSEGFSNAQLAARNAYNALATEEEKIQVTNYNLLEDMEANIAYIMQAVNTLPDSEENDISKNDIIISDEDTCPGHIITGISSEYHISIENGTHTVTLKNVSITSNTYSPIDIQSGSVTLSLEGQNVIKNEAGGDNAAIRVSSDATLTIQGTGHLKIENGLQDGIHEANGAGIGGNFQESPQAITIKEGTIVVEQYGTSAAIGGGTRADSGKISIEGGNVDVTVLPVGGDIESAGTGIGGGGENVADNSLIGSAGSADVSITGGTVKAHVESSIFDFGTISSGAAIGAGENKGGEIYIGGTAHVDASATNLACAIGSSNATWGSSGDNVTPPPTDDLIITIEGNSVVSAKTESLDFYGQGAYAGAAIGMSVQNLQPCSITIGGNANVTAKGSWYGAGIGGSYVQINKQAQPINITIKDQATVDASAEVYGAAIGSGYGDSGAESATIVIEGNPTVKASGGWGGAGIGGGKGTQGGSITITGGNITAIGDVGGRDLFGIPIGGAGIGSGAVDDSDGYGGCAGDIIIGGTAKVKAYGSVGSAGIGGGNLEAVTTTGTPSTESRNDNGGGVESITITGNASVYAVGGTGASGIGAGAIYEGCPEPRVESITIEDSTTVEAYADGAKFAIDSDAIANKENITDEILNARFDKDAELTSDGQELNLLLDNASDSHLKMPEKYRSFARTISKSGTVRVQNGEDGKQDIFAYYPDNGEKKTDYTIQPNVMLDKDNLNWIKQTPPTPDPGPGPDPGPDPDPKPNPDPDDNYEESSFPRIKLPTTTIEDEDVPLTDLPTTTIEDEEVPLKDIPNTGDMIPVPGMVAAVVSLGGVLLLAKKRK
ncbi:doubled motif LPXTG anchor domain-containing protein [Negativibacillus massiliensis]|uniref:doubled motif LPXTG anchor domain-containing protein n=1 Tax=Negativibacillus massiliensis TaxID=1871035 RepID=UPI003AF1EE5A